MQSVEVAWTLDKADWCRHFFFLQAVELFEKWSCGNKREIKVSEWACIHAQYSVQTYLSRCHLLNSYASLGNSLVKHWQRHPAASQLRLQMFDRNLLLIKFYLQETLAIFNTVIDEILIL